MKFIFLYMHVLFLSVTWVSYAEKAESLNALESPVAVGPTAEEMRQYKIEREKKERARQARIKKHTHKIQKFEKEMQHIDGIVLSFTGRMDDMERDIDELDAKESKARVRLSDKLDLFNATAMQIARLERLPLEAMAAATSLRAGHDRKTVVASGRKSLSELIQKNRDDIYEIQEIKVQRQSKKDEIQALRHNLLSERSNLQNLFEKQIELLALDDASKSRLASKARKAKQEKTVTNLLEQFSKIEHYLPPVRYNLKKLPVKGQLIEGYDDKKSSGIHAQGITIETTAKEPVVSVKDGRVIYSDIFRDYGYMVIVEHSDGSHTLYSGLEKSNRQIGFFAPAGVTIGYMPKNDKPVLYLEVRKNGKTLDPVKYLKLNETS